MNGDEILLTDIDAILRDVEFGPAASQLPIKGLAAWTMELGIEHIHSPLITDLGLSCTAEGQGDAWSFDFDTDGLIGEAEEGRFEVHFRGQQPVYRLRYEILDFEAADLQAKLREESLLRGKMDILADLSSTGKGWRELLHNTNGQIVQRGEDLLLQGVDLDKILENFKRSQAFNLADVGAFFLAGPLGVMATKGGDFARLTNMTEGDRTQIPRLLSHVQINGGIFETRDVAFTTTKNRIALKGKVDLPLKRIESLAAAAVDKQGCILISQSVSGDFKDPQWGKVDVVGTLLGAVVNILKLVAGDRCQPFYTGSVPHPER
jgi:AsmA protein